LRSSLPPEFDDALARAAGRLGIFAGEPLWFADVSSTNDVALALAEQGAAEGRLVLANAQAAGRGRHGRAWASPPGAGLYVSAVLRPAPHAVSLLTIAAGLAVAEGIQSATGLATGLKWPNDVYAGERKLAGMLAEAGAPLDTARGAPSDSRRAAIVLGIGINVLPAAYPPDVAARATSLEGELGRVVDRGLLLAECLAALAVRYDELQRGESDVVAHAWRQRAASMGRTVRWDAAGLAREGVAETIDATGALIVRTASGRVRLISGELQWT
jgi:BirA family biotin operon repressor/biotin-[acetyl-CoA-carboxylase] ligase